MNLDEKFTDLADTVSSAVGRWPVTAAAVSGLVLWLALGPIMRFSDAWQLAANTPTTWLELFLGFLACAAANRLERRNHILQQQQQQTLDALARTETQNHQLLERVAALEERQATHYRETARDHSAMLHGIYVLVRELHAAQVPGGAPTSPPDTPTEPPGRLAPVIVPTTDPASPQAA